MYQKILKSILFFLPCFAANSLFAQVTVNPVATSCTYEIQANLNYPTCPGGEDGSIQLVVSSSLDGDIGIHWPALDFVPVGMEDNIQGLAAGTYLCDLTDGEGCTETFIFELLEPTPAEIEIEQENVSCNGRTDGRFVVNVDTDAADFTYALEGNIDVQISPVFEELPAGTYIVNVYDGNNCQSQRSILIEEPEELRFQVNSVDPSCPGADDGGFSFESSGGTGPFRYFINNSELLTVTDFNALPPADNYVIRIVDRNGCDAMEQFSISDPVAPEVTTESTEISCPDENDATVSIIIIDSGIGAPVNYEYSLDNIDFSEDSIFTDLAPGDYTFYARSDAGCSYETFVSIQEKEEPTILSTVNDTPCLDGVSASIDIIIIDSGVGAPIDYEYSLDGINFFPDSTFMNVEPGDYTITIRSSEGCLYETTSSVLQYNPPEIISEITAPSCPGELDATVAIIIIDSGVGSPIEYEYSIDGVSYGNDSIIGGLGAGTYTVDILSSEGCLFEEEVIIEPLSVPDVETETIAVSCPGGNDATVAIIIIDSGIGAPINYEYSLDNITYVEDSIFSGLTAGMYTVYARSDAGCVFASELIIEELEEPEIGFEIQDESCGGNSDGSFIIIIDSGIGILGGDFDFSLDSINFQPDSIFNNLNAGDYTVYIRSEENCILISNLSIGVGAELNASMTLEHETCTYANGWIACNLVNGTPPFGYLWNSGENTPVIQDLSAGEYSVQVRDLNGCIFEDTVTIFNEAAPIIYSEKEDVACFEGTDGKIDLEIISSSQTLNYIWSHGPQTQNVDQLKAGQYSITLTDENQCISSEVFQISEPDPIVLEGIIKTSLTNSSIQVEAKGGTAPYAYRWSTGDESSFIINLNAGAYSLTVVDAKQCEATAFYRIDKDSIFDDSDLLLFPNPVNDEINIAFNFPEGKKVKIQIVDELGRVLYWTPEQVFGTEVWKLDISHFADAMYFLKIYVDGKCEVKKFAKQSH